MYPHSIAWQGIQYVLSPFFVDLTSCNCAEGGKETLPCKKIITAGCCWDYRNALTWLLLFWCINEVTMFFLLHTFLAIRVSHRCIATWSLQFRDTLGLTLRPIFLEFYSQKSYCWVAMVATLMLSICQRIKKGRWQ